MPFLKRLLKHWVLIVLVGLTVLSIVVVSPIDMIYFIRHVKFLFWAVVLCVIFFETLRTDRERIKGVEVLGYGALAFGIFSVVYNLLGFNVTYDHRLQGPLDSAVYLAFYLAPFLLFFLMRFFENRKKSHLLFAVILLALLIATRSMAALVVSFGVLMVYLYKRADLKIFRSGWVKGLMVAVFLLILGVTFYFKILPSFQTHNTSLGEREEIWATTVELLRDPKHLIFGLGYGQFQPFYQQNVEAIIGHKPLDFVILQPHNIFLLFMVQYGLFGLAFILFCFYGLFQRLRSPDPQHHKSSFMASFILLYFFLHGLIDTPFFKNDLMILLLLFAIMALESPLQFSSKKQ